MNMFQNIPISEKRLILEVISYTAMTVLIIGVFVFFLISLCNQTSKKEKARIAKLKNLAFDGDKKAQKELDKYKRKAKRKHLLNGEWIYTIMLPLLLVAILIGSSIFTALSWTDYIKKDYVKYTGPYEAKNRIITLPNGTTVYGSPERDDGGTIVYSRRTRRLLSE